MHFRRNSLITMLVGCVFLASCSSSGGADTATSTSLSASSPTSTGEVALPVVPSSAGQTATTDSATSTTVTPAPIGLLALTGLPAFDEAILLRPVVAAKIDNVEAARPQAGLSLADVVYEELVEGGLTRLLAIFHSNNAAVIGPIRSARSTDVPLLTPLRAPLFAWSGANAAFASLIRSVAIRDVGFETSPGAYSRADDRQAPSDLMTSTDDLYAIGGVDGDETPNKLFDHLLPGEPPVTGAVAEGVRVEYGATTVEHRWDSSLSGWARTQNGSPHVDTSGAVIAPQNVIVQFVDYRDTGLVDAAGSAVPEAVLTGGGDAWFLSNGTLIEGSWTKANVTARSQYVDADGRGVRITPGSTWVLLAPVGSATLL